MQRACRHRDTCAFSTPRLLLTPADLLLEIVYHRRLNDRNGVTDGECSLSVSCHYSQKDKNYAGFVSLSDPASLDAQYTLNV